MAIYVAPAAGMRLQNSCVLSVTDIEIIQNKRMTNQELMGLCNDGARKQSFIRVKLQVFD